MHPTSITDNKCTGTTGKTARSKKLIPCGNSLIFVDNLGWICNNPNCSKYGVQNT